MDANQWPSNATDRRDAARGAVVGRSHVVIGDHSRRARTQLGMSHYHRPAVDGHDPSGAGCGRPAQQRSRGSRDHLPQPQPVLFVSAAGSGAASSRDLEHSRKPGSCDPVWQAVAPWNGGSLAANTVVANMMKRMNYKEGSGLGKHGQGITAPIEFVPRPKNAGLGTVEGSSRGGWDEPPTSADNWPKWDNSGGAKKRSRNFTALERDDAAKAQKRDPSEELDEETLGRPLEKGSATEAFVWVQNALARASPGGGGGGQENLCCGEEMAAAVTKAMQWVQEESASGTLTVGELIKKFKALKVRCPREYPTFRLADTARAIVAPPLRSLFRQWKPLKDPSRGLNAVNMLRDVLLDDGSAVSPFAALVDDVVVQAVRAAAAAEWDARDYAPMLRFLETWGDTLPSDAIQSLLEQAMLPKLAAAVESWEPRWEPEPCHAWVHPYIPLLGRRLERVYVTVRRKLGKALVGCHPPRAGEDYHMVLPWKDVFGPAMWGDLVERSVVPYLKEGLRALRVPPPPKQDNGDFSALMKWASVVEMADMARFLDEAFFGKWLDALRRWLWAARPAVKEAVAWHEGWKRLLPPELLVDERVRAALKAGLVMINRSAQGLEIDRSGLTRAQNAGDGEAHWRQAGRQNDKHKRY